MMKREVAEENEDDVVLPEIDDTFCLVCGRSPASRCYGSRACGSCKAFFLRITTIKEAVPPCSESGKCASKDFLIRGKEKCRACRYRKCLEAGMIPDVTARRKGCVLREKRSQIGFQRRRKKNESKSRNSEEIFRKEKLEYSIDSREMQLAALVSPTNQIPSSAASTSLSVLVNLEKILLNDNEALPNRLDFTYDLSYSVTDLLNNPVSVCPRVPVGFGTPLPHDLSMDHIQTMPARILSRLTVQMADWFRNIPEIWELLEHERTLLFCQKFLVYFFLLLYYYSHKEGFNGLVHAFGTSVSLDDVEIFKTMEEGYKLMLKYGFSTIMPTLRKANVKDEEYVLLKNITIFSSAIGFSDSGAEVIRRAYNKYSTLLLEHLNKTCADRFEAIGRFSNIMAIPSFLQSAAQKMNPEFGQHILCNRGGIGTVLASEIFNKS